MTVGVAANGPPWSMTVGVAANGPPWNIVPGVAANGPPWNMTAGAAAIATAKAATGIARTSFLRFTIFLLDVGYLSRSSRHLGRYMPGRWRPGYVMNLELRIALTLTFTLHPSSEGRSCLPEGAHFLVEGLHAYPY
jgi:hypothetical protein